MTSCSAEPPVNPAVTRDVDANSDAVWGAEQRADACTSAPRQSLDNSRSQSPAPGREEAVAARRPADDEHDDGMVDEVLNYERGESAVNSARSTPPHCRWARDLHCVLEDYEGMVVFQEYLQDEGCVTAMDFYYAHKRLGIDWPSWQDTERAQHLYAIYSEMVRRGGPGRHFVACLREQTRAVISKRLHDKEYDKDLFDDAHAEVMEFLRLKHAEFVRSEQFIRLCQQAEDGGAVDSPKLSAESQSSASSMCGEAARIGVGALPVLLEEEPFAYSDADTVRAETLAEPPAEPKIVAPRADEPPPLPPRHTTKAPSRKTKQVGAASSKLLPPTDAPATQSKKKTASDDLTATVLSVKNLKATIPHRNVSTLPRGLGASVPNPYHTPYVPNLPPSTIDSAANSAVSSDADVFSNMSGKRRNQAQSASRYDHQMRHCERQTRDYQQNINREASMQETIIPRTQMDNLRSALRPDGDVAQRRAFAEDLARKLEKLRADNEQTEHFNESLRQIDEGRDDKSAQTRAIENYERKHAKRGDDDGSRILDEHYHKIGWDSAKQSPGGTQRSPGAWPHWFGHRRSPGSKSPSRSNTLCRAAAAAIGQSLMTSSLPNGGFVPRFPGTVGGATPVAALASASSSSRQKHSSRTAPDAGAPRQAAGASSSKKHYRMAVSDTSGIESGVSSGTSMVSGLAAMAGTSRTQWVSGGEKTVAHFGPLESKFRSNQRLTPLQQDSAARRGRRSADGLARQAADASGKISVTYHMPGEETPYKSAINAFATLRQFKQILPKKGRFKYFFLDKDMETGVVRREVSNDNDVLPTVDGKIETWVFTVD